MGEPAGREGEDGLAETGALPEGAARQSANPAQRAGMQAARVESATSSCLDLAAAMDEPEQLIRELKRIAAERSGDSRAWEGIRRLCERAEEYFEVINRPEANRPQGSKLGDISF
jgi:hypothetical protein